MLNWGFRVYQRFGQTHFFSFTFCFLLRILKAHFLRFFYPPLCISGIMKEGRKEGRRFYVLQKFNMIDSGLYNENVNDHCKGNDHIADDMFDGIIDILDFPMEDVEINGEVEELQGESSPLDDLSALPCPFTGNSCNDPPTPTEPIIIDTCSGNISLHGDSSDDKESLQQNSTACGSRKFTSEPIAQTVEVSEGYPNSMKEKQKKKKKKKLSQISGAMGVKKQWCRQQPSTIGRCMHCNVTKTPQWREGPYGPKTLCNACGVCYKRGSLFPQYRPVSSPTFVASLHTNSRKKVIEMRHKSGQVAAVGASPTLVATSLPSNSNDKVRKTISNKDGKAVEMRNEGIIRVGAATSTFLANSDSKRDETVVTEADMEASMAFTTPISISVTTSSSPHRKVIDRQGAATSTTPTFVASLHSNSHKKCSFQQPVAVRKCMHCETTETPLWRQGPGGPKSLCNACGIRYKSGRLLPEYHPAASPSFVASLHSNSHKKVVEMRKVQVQAAQQQLSSAAAATDTALPHLPQLLP